MNAEILPMNVLMNFSMQPFADLLLQRVFYCVRSVLNQQYVKYLTGCQMTAGKH